MTWKYMNGVLYISHSVAAAIMISWEPPHSLIIILGVQISKKYTQIYKHYAANVTSNGSCWTWLTCSCSRYIKRAVMSQNGCEQSWRIRLYVTPKSLYVATLIIMCSNSRSHLNPKEPHSSSSKICRITKSHYFSYKDLVSSPCTTTDNTTTVQKQKKRS